MYLNEYKKHFNTIDKLLCALQEGLRDKPVWTDGAGKWRQGKITNISFTADMMNNPRLRFNVTFFCGGYVIEKRVEDLFDYNPDFDTDYKNLKKNKIMSLVKDIIKELKDD